MYVVGFAVEFNKLRPEHGADLPEGASLSSSIARCKTCLRYLVTNTRWA